MITPIDPCPVDAEWRLVELYPDYDVSEYGHIRRSRKGDLIIQHRMMSIHFQRYFHCNIAREKKNYCVRVHRLVAMAFLSDTKEIHRNLVAHNDGNVSNCHYSNLRWATAAENMSDRKIHGTHNCGANHGNAKLTEQQVLEIISSPFGARIWARRLGMGVSTIAHIRNGRAWKHIAREGGTS